MALATVRECQRGIVPRWLSINGRRTSWTPARTLIFGDRPTGQRVGLVPQFSVARHERPFPLSRPLESAFVLIRADSSCGEARFVEDQPVEVVGQIGERQFRLGPLEPDGADEQPEAGLLMGEDVLDPGADR